MKIDSHTHLDTTDPDLLKAFVAECEKLETRACLFSVGPRCDHPYIDNDAVMNAAKHYPDHLIPFAFVDLWDTVDSDCVKRYAEAGFRGLKCITPYFPYDHDSYMPVYEKAEQLGLPIVFHTGNYRANKTDLHDRRPMVTNMSPLTMDRIARSFQNLKVIMAHLGSSLFRHEAAGMLKLHPNVHADLAGTGSYQALTPEELTNLLRLPLAEGNAALTSFGKLVMGSDAYVSTPHLLSYAQTCYRDLLDSIGIDPPLQDRIFGHNLSSWLESH